MSLSSRAGVQRLTAGCCVAGGGPAGVMLGLLLAKAGVDVVVLEKHDDFFRDFRGDTIHPSTLDVLDQLGLRAQFDAIVHSDITTLDLVINGNRITPVDFSMLPGPNAKVALMPQWDFLTVLADAGKSCAQFRLMMGTEVTGLLRDKNRISGVVASGPDGFLEIRAPLTVAADGRDSATRTAAGLVPTEYGVAIDVLWFHLPQPPSPPPDTLGYLDDRSLVITIPRPGYYQAGMLIKKGTYPEIQAEGLPAFRSRIHRAAPVLSTVTDQLDDWNQIKLLTVQINRLDHWWLPGLLCIGDAAHAMSPAFGVGVNYAIQDAVAAANILTPGLLTGVVSPNDLQRVQARRLPPVRRMQPIQLLLHAQIAKPGGGFLHHPMRWWERAIAAVVLPVARPVAARIIGRGFRPERIETPSVVGSRSGVSPHEVVNGVDAVVDVAEAGAQRRQSEP